MNNFSLPEFAGFLSTSFFVISNFPMLFKAFKTRNLKSYSFLQIAIANMGNIIYWLYIFSLPFGSIWLLHGYNTFVTFLMLVLYFKYRLNIKFRQVS